MATPPTLVHLAFAAGLDEAQQTETLDPMGAFVVLQNVRQDRYGGFGKRLGYASLIKTLLDNTSRPSGFRMFMNGDQPCVIDGTWLDVWADTLNVGVVKGRVPETTYRILECPTPRLSNAIDTPDTVTVDGINGTYVAIVWRAAGQDLSTHVAFATLLDADNGAVILPVTKLKESDTLTVKLAAYDAHVLAFVFDADSGEIQQYHLDVTSRATIAAGWSLVGSSLATDYLSLGRAVSLVGVDGAAIAYVNDSAGASQITVRTADITGGLASATINTSSETPLTLDISEGSTTLWVAWNEDEEVKACGLNESGLATTATTTLLITAPTDAVLGMYVGPGLSAGNATVFASHLLQNTYAVAITEVAGATAADGSIAILGNAVCRSRPFLREGRLYAHFSSKNASEMILCDCTQDLTGTSDLTTWLRPVAAPIQREIWSTCSDRIARIAGTSKYLSSFVVRKSGTTFGASLVEYDFVNAYRWKPATLNGSTFLGGGVTSIFDGSRIFEANMLTRPPVAQIYSVGTSGSVTLSSGRKYILTYEDVDADGNWHVSGASDPSPSTGPITGMQIELTLQPLSITSRGFTTEAIHVAEDSTGLRIGVWGTLNGGEPPYYRVGEATNDPNDTAIDFVDNLDDAVLATKALLYGNGSIPGTGGSQDHRAPPGLLYHVSYNGMLVGATGKQVWYSGQPIDGEGTWFSPVFSFLLDEDVTGIAVQDGTVLVFTANSVWTTAGDPPSDNAAQGGLSTPRKASINHGCINANSIVTTSAGTFFQSRRGIELVSRGGLNSVFIGDKVQETLALFPVVTAAVLDTKHGLVRFSLAESQADGIASDEGRDLVFDLTLNLWISVDDKRGGMASQASQDACMAYVEGSWRYCWLTPAGTLYYERAEDDASAYVDVTSWITMVAETGAFKLGGIQGKQHLNHVLFLERKETDHDLSVALAYNYETSFRTPRVWTKTEINALLTAGWPITQLKHEPHDDAECQGVRIRIEDATPTSGTVGTGKGATWLALTLDITPKPGVFEVPEEAA